MDALAPGEDILEGCRVAAFLEQEAGLLEELAHGAEADRPGVPLLVGPYGEDLVPFGRRVGLFDVATCELGISEDDSRGTGSALPGKTEAEAKVPLARRRRSTMR